MKALIISTTVISGLVGLFTGAWTVAGILFLAFLAIDILIAKDFL